MKDSTSLIMAREYLGRKVQLEFDQPVGSSYKSHNIESYPINYGYIPNTFAPDGDGLDAYLLCVYEPMKKAEGICIAIIHRKNDDDDKLVVVPEGIELSDDEIMSEVSFQEKLYDSIVVR